MATGAMRAVLVRLHPEDEQLLDWIATEMRWGRAGAVATALRHLYATLQQGQPIQPTVPPVNAPGGSLARLSQPPSGADWRSAK
jgi:hypothetical protein